jgi:hypothetical protein
VRGAAALRPALLVLASALASAPAMAAPGTKDKGASSAEAKGKAGQEEPAPPQFVTPPDRRNPLPAAILAAMRERLIARREGPAAPEAADPPAKPAAEAGH